MRPTCAPGVADLKAARKCRSEVAAWAAGLLRTSLLLQLERQDHLLVPSPSKKVQKRLADTRVSQAMQSSEAPTLEIYSVENTEPEIVIEVSLSVKNGAAEAAAGAADPVGAFDPVVPERIPPPPRPALLFCAKSRSSKSASSTTRFRGGRLARCCSRANCRSCKSCVRELACAVSRCTVPRANSDPSSCSEPV